MSSIAESKSACFPEKSVSIGVEVGLQSIGAVLTRAPKFHDNFLVVENVSPGDFISFREKASDLIGIGKIRFSYIQGSIILVEYPSAIHSYVVSTISNIVSVYDYTHTTLNGRSPLVHVGDTDRKLTGGDIVSPDWSVKVRGRGCPNVAIEVAVTQSFIGLHHKCRQYIIQTQNIMCVIGVKIFARRWNGTEKVLVMKYRRRSNLVEVISFGSCPMSGSDIEYIEGVITRDGQNTVEVTGFGIGAAPPCDRSGMLQYRVSVDYRDLLCIDNTAERIPPEFGGITDNLIIDLYRLKEAIVDAATDADADHDAGIAAAAAAAVGAGAGAVMVDDMPPLIDMEVDPGRFVGGHQQQEDRGAAAAAAAEDDQHDHFHEEGKWGTAY